MPTRTAWWVEDQRELRAQTRSCESTMYAEKARKETEKLQPAAAKARLRQLEAQRRLRGGWRRRCGGGAGIAWADAQFLIDRRGKNSSDDGVRRSGALFFSFLSRYLIYTRGCPFFFFHYLLSAEAPLRALPLASASRGPSTGHRLLRSAKGVTGWARAHPGTFLASCSVRADPSSAPRRKQ